MKNEILENLWKAKDEIAKEHGYDVGKLVRALRLKEKEGEVEVVDLSKNIKKAS